MAEYASDGDSVEVSSARSFTPTPTSSDIRQLAKPTAPLTTPVAVALLRGGSTQKDTWNTWRQAGGVVPSLEGADLANSNISRFDLTGCNLSNANLAGVVAEYANMNGAILLGADLSGARFTGAKLVAVRAQGARFTDANLVNADLRAASLQWADFARADMRSADLRQAQLDLANFALADLAGARFDEQRFGQLLALVEAASSSARNATLALLATCAYSLLSGGGVRRAALLTDSGDFKLPLLDAEVSARTFFTIAPLACLLGFAYVNFHRYHVLRLLLKLPARFPDGLTLSERTYPWPFNMLFEQRLGGAMIDKEQILLERERPFRAARLTAQVGNLAATFVTWRLVLVTMAVLALRIVSVQRWGESLVATTAFWLCAVLAIALRRREQTLVATYAGQPGPARIKSLFFLGSAALCLTTFVLASPPINAKLNVANLENEDLTGANLEGSRLERADLRSSNLKGARLKDSDLRYAKLYDSNLTRTYAPRANFHCAILEGAQLTEAVSTQANFTRAVLRGADLRHGHFQYAHFEGADLSGALLKGADLTEVHCNAATKWPNGTPPVGVQCEGAATDKQPACVEEQALWSQSL